MTTVALAASHHTKSSASSPWAFHLHLAAWLVIVLLAVLYTWLLTRPRSREAATGSRRWIYLAGGLAALALAITWPLADISTHTSLTALLAQRLLITLGAAPLLLMAVPTVTLARITRPAVIDAALAFFSRPLVAVVTFSAVAIATLTPAAVEAQASSGPARAAIDALLLFGGVVLWAPVLHTIPGAYRPTPLGTAVYLFVQSIIPTFPAVIFIFSNHTIYSTFDSTKKALGMSPLGDQHLAGIVAKVATLPVLWTVAWISLSRAQTADTEMRDPYPLTWAEVERQLQRAERAERRGPPRRRRVSAIPRPVAGGWSQVEQASPSDPATGGPGPPTPTA